MKTWIGALAVTVLSTGSAFGYDNGPQTISCDYKFGKSEGTTKCLIIGSGMNQGISWIVFEVQRKRFRFDDSSPDGIQLIDMSGNTVAKHRVSNSNGQCHPGGRSADIYAFESGDRICLYW